MPIYARFSVWCLLHVFTVLSSISYFGRSIIWFILVDLFWLLDQQGLDEFLHKHILVWQRFFSKINGKIKSGKSAWHSGCVKACASGGSVPWYLAWTKVCLLHPLAGTMDQSNWGIWPPLHAQRCFVIWSAQTASQKRRDYVFRRQLDEKPSVIPGCQHRM